MGKIKSQFWGILFFTLTTTGVFAGEADIKIPDLATVNFTLFNIHFPGMYILYAGLLVCVLGAVFGLMQYQQTRNLPVHESMRLVSNTIWETCKTYLWQQGKFLAILWVLIAVCMTYYFLGLQDTSFG